VIVVPDTNVLIAALVAKGLCAEVITHAIRERSLVSSVVLLDELDETVRAKFQVTPAVAAFLKLFRKEIRLVEPVLLSKPVCRDADDDLVLGTAVAAKADWIVTGDADLLVLGSYRQIAIITPRQYVERMMS
jgi:putative PIN family toxin of toxin-antitoxin system